MKNGVPLKGSSKAVPHFTSSDLSVTHSICAARQTNQMSEK